MKKITKNKKKGQHIHLQDIPDKYFPKNSKAKKYRDELLRMMSNLRFTNERIQYSAQICSFNIRSITHKFGFVPSKTEVFRHMAEYVYHYENYCFRAYSFREKLLQFMNAVLKLNFDERDVKIKFIKINPTVIEAKLIPILDKFDKKGNLKKIIQDRNSLTHKLYYGEAFDYYLRPIMPNSAGEAEFKKWISGWKREITTRSKHTEEFTYVVACINHELATKLVKYKDSLSSRK